VIIIASRFQWSFLRDLPDASQIRWLEEEAEKDPYLDEKKNNMLHIAAAFCSLEVLKYFLGKLDSWTNHKNAFGCTLLMSACQDSSTSSIDKISYLLDEGFYINEVDTNHNSPLHVASAVNTLPVIKYLVDRGAEVNTRNNSSIGVSQASLLQYLGRTHQYIRLQLNISLSLIIC